MILGKNSSCFQPLPMRSRILNAKVKEDKFVLKVAKLEDAEKIHGIMVTVYEELENKELYICDDLEFVKANMEENGFCIVAYDCKGNIAGTFLIRYPGDAEDNLGRDLNFSVAEQKRVVHMESAVVLPEYRGNHLQSKMLQYGEAFIDKEKYQYLMATVSPDNPASYKSLEKNGYRHVLTKEKYQGLKRRIYCKKIAF